MHTSQDFIAVIQLAVAVVHIALMITTIHALTMMEFALKKLTVDNIIFYYE